MFDDDTLHQILDEGRLPIAVATKMLDIYVCESDWKVHISQLYGRLTKKYDEESARVKARKTIAFTILLPAHDKSVKIDVEHPGNNLFRWSYFHQFQEKDWFSELQKVVRKDADIAEHRRHLLYLGVIDPIDYQPHCRQAFQWMCEKAEADGVTVDQGLRKNFRRILMVYGGAISSYMFEKHPHLIRRIPNWRSGYFFERAIYRAYSKSQIVKIKEAEIRDMNPKLVKKIRKA